MCTQVKSTNYICRFEGSGVSGLNRHKSLFSGLFTALQLAGNASVYFIFILFLFCIPVHSDPSVSVLGGKAGWNNLLMSKNITPYKGRYGYTALGLSSSLYSETEETDLYLNFDAQPLSGEHSMYSLVTSSAMYVPAEQARIGGGAALCNSHVKAPAVVLKPNPGAFFYGLSSVKSFTLEFWLYPQVVESGSVLMQWRSSLLERKQTMYQNISASIINNKLEWSFLNIWRDKNGRGLDIKLQSKSNVIPSRWTHHTLTYNENLGLLEYRINGYTESIVYLTPTGREDAQVLYSMMGTPSDVYIGLNYSGLIDEIKLTKKFSEPYSLKEVSALFERYETKGGRFESNIIDTGGNKSIISRLIADYECPDQTDTVFFVRAANTQYNWTYAEPEWIPVKSQEEIKNVQGRFLQISCDVYADAAGQKTPLIHSIRLEYEKDEPPNPPAKIYAEAKDGSITLSWVPSIDFDVKGYLIYFGDAKGEYVFEGSPINAGNVLSYKLDGLKNGKVYFFAVAAYDADGPEHAGSLSREVWGRPLQGK